MIEVAWAKYITCNITKKGELPRLVCFHNGIILIVTCLKTVANIKN